MGWISENMVNRGVDADELECARKLLLLLYKKTEEKNDQKKVYGECVLRFIDEPEIIIKDNGTLFNPDIEDNRYNYNVLMSCNRNMISLSFGKTVSYPE